MINKKSLDLIKYWKKKSKKIEQKKGLNFYIFIKNLDKLTIFLYDYKIDY